LAVLMGPGSAPGRMSAGSAPWWTSAVVYQVYPRSFQDSDGDGVGDLRGIAARLDHVASLGADALWLSPITPSPGADWGYDVSDYTDVDPAFGTLADLDALVEAAHARGLRLLLDLVPCHTSIEHPWFREHPDRYIWSPVDGPPNNWVAAFGGPAWSRDERSGRWYLHSFYPEQPDLDWRNPELVEAMQGVVRFWLDRGVDGFRLDALNLILKDAELRDDPPASGAFPLPRAGESGTVDHVYSDNRPDAVDAVRAIRAAAGDALLVGEVYLPTSEYARWLEVVDLVFGFELLFCPWDAERLRAAIEPAAGLERTAWVMSNHDFDRLATRVGPENLRAAAVLLLTLPGAAFVYQGDELGLANGPGHEPPFDRAGRDRLRHPMQWDASPTGGFTTGEPWLPLVDPQARNVEAQRGDADSLLELYRRLLALRDELGEGFRLLAAEPGVVAFERGTYTVAVNTTAERRAAPPGEVVLATHAADALLPHAALIVRN
ncbi:MAG TPA: alpha-amylase family glycosyl hydrolase, partial [Gaiellaceae bacterium]|nr:alpha-amylase family glycosyl hydrolase [Gaiellaceae bacterium]